MIFSKKTWRKGQKVTKDDINRIENGIYEALLKLDAIGTSLTVQEGRAIVDTSGHKTGQTIFERYVEFPTPFSRKPVVVVSAETSGPNAVFASPKGSSYVTNSGFTVVVYRSSNAGADSTSVSWIAAAPTE